MPVATPSRALAMFWSKFKVAKSDHMSPKVTPSMAEPVPGNTTPYNGESIPATEVRDETMNEDPPNSEPIPATQVRDETMKVAPPAASECTGMETGMEGDNGNTPQNTELDSVSSAPQGEEPVPVETKEATPTPVDHNTATEAEFDKLCSDHDRNVEPLMEWVAKMDTIELDARIANIKTDPRYAAFMTCIDRKMNLINDTFVFGSSPIGDFAVFELWCDADKITRNVHVSTASPPQQTPAISGPVSALKAILTRATTVDLTINTSPHPVVPNDPVVPKTKAPVDLIITTTPPDPVVPQQPAPVVATTPPTSGLDKQHPPKAEVEDDQVFSLVESGQLYS